MRTSRRIGGQVPEIVSSRLVKLNRTWLVVGAALLVGLLIGWGFGGGSALFITVVSGILLFMLGQAVLRFVIKPIQAQRKAITNVLHILSSSMPVVAGKEPVNPQAEQVETTLRNAAADLIRTTESIPLYDWWARLNLVPTRSDVVAAHNNLLNLSGAVVRPGVAVTTMLDQARRAGDSLGLEKIFPGLDLAAAEVDAKDGDTHVSPPRRSRDDSQ
jgi:hypothetical protein